MSRMTVLMMISEFVRPKKYRNLKQVITNQLTMKNNRYKALASCWGGYTNILGNRKKPKGKKK